MQPPSQSRSTLAPGGTTLGSPVGGGNPASSAAIAGGVSASPVSARTTRQKMLRLSRSMIRMIPSLSRDRANSGACKARVAHDPGGGLPEPGTSSLAVGIARRDGILDSTSTGVNPAVGVVAAFRGGRGSRSHEDSRSVYPWLTGSDPTPKEGRSYADGAFA